MARVFPLLNFGILGGFLGGREAGGTGSTNLLEGPWKQMLGQRHTLRLSDGAREMGHPGPENQDSQHMIDQPRGSFAECCTDVQKKPSVWKASGCFSLGKSTRKKTTQNKKCSSERVFLNNYRWVPDSRHGEEGKNSRELFEKVRVNAPFFWYFRVRNKGSFGKGVFTERSIFY